MIEQGKNEQILLHAITFFSILAHTKYFKLYVSSKNFFRCYHIDMFILVNEHSLSACYQLVFFWCFQTFAAFLSGCKQTLAIIMKIGSWIPIMQRQIPTDHVARKSHAKNATDRFRNPTFLFAKKMTRFGKKRSRLFVNKTKKWKRLSSGFEVTGCS